MPEEVWGELRLEVEHAPAGTFGAVEPRSGSGTPRGQEEIDEFQSGSIEDRL
jgi:hypothetical protein